MRFELFRILQVLEHAMSQRNPKIQSEAISWLKVSILDFGIKGIDIKMVIEKVKTAFGATNPVSITYILGWYPVYLVLILRFLH